MRGTLVQLNTSPGGIPKTSILSAQVTEAGVEGDWQTNRKVHGGPDRAICLYSVELYDALRKDGIDLQPGAVGENFTTSGVDLQSIGIGSKLRVGACTIEITNVREPCATLKKCHVTLPQVITGRSGWMARVLQPGFVKPGDVIEVL
jgi:MOSC domain-containing protein YiiM